MLSKRNQFKSLFTIFLLISSFPSPVRAEVTHDFASWNGVLLQGRLTGKFGFYLEVQNRLNETLSNRNTFIIRPALRYLFSPQLSLWLGYGWMPLFGPFRSENRIWQQALYQDDLGLWQLSGRLRFDERWLGNTSEVSFRSRVMLRVLRFMDDNRGFALCGWNEVFYHINSVANGPTTGFDQNRLFVGINFQIGEYVRLEPGYLNVFINQADPQSDVMFHAFAVYTVVNF